MCNLEKRRLKHGLLSSNVFILFVRILLGVTFSENWAQGRVPQGSKSCCHKGVYWDNRQNLMMDYIYKIILI